MTRLQHWLARVATFLATVFFWTWLAMKGLVTLIGATTVADDYNQFVDRLPAILSWLFSTPWWVPAALASILTTFLIWLSWPRSSGEAKAAEAPQPTPPNEGVRPGSYSPTAPLVDMEIDLTRLSHAAPWLRFHCTAYNATSCSLRIISVQGRIKIGSEEFHNHLELDSVKFMYGEGFFNFSLKLALSTSEAAHIQKAAEANHLSIGFRDASIEVSIHTEPHNTTTRSRLPMTLQFETRERRPAPAFVRQVMNP